MCGWGIQFVCGVVGVGVVNPFPTGVPLRALSPLFRPISFASAPLHWSGGLSSLRRTLVPDAAHRKPVRLHVIATIEGRAVIFQNAKPRII